MILKIAEAPLNTKFGTFHEVLYYDGKQDIFALIMGNVSGGESVLCRVHSSCIFAHHFNSVECDCREQMEMSQQLIQKEGKGIVIWMDQEGKANGHFALLKSKELQKSGMSQSEAYEALGFKKDARDFSRAAEILQDLGVKSIRMLTNNPKKVETLTRHGIQVLGTQSITLDPGDNAALRKTIDDKIGDGHLY